jgi:hypothetical protein
MTTASGPTLASLRLAREQVLVVLRSLGDLPREEVPAHLRLVETANDLANRLEYALQASGTFEVHEDDGEA